MAAVGGLLLARALVLLFHEARGDLECIKHGYKSVGARAKAHGVPAGFLLNPAVDGEGLQEWMDAATQLLVVQLLLTARVLFL